MISTQYHHGNRYDELGGSVCIWVCTLNHKLSSAFWQNSIACFLVWVSHGDAALAQQSLQVRTERWLQVEQVSGNVMLRNTNGLRPAKKGDRLQLVGDEIQTDNNSKAVLVVDIGIGTIQVDENTTLRIHALQIAADNGRVTQIDVPRGRVRLQVRRFTNRGSQLDIFTPAGVSGVRGTQFGVGVQPNGKTSVATLKGKVITEAKSQSVLIGAGFQNFTLPGKSPSALMPLNNNPQLRYEVLKTVQGNTRKVWLSAQIDPTHAAKVNGILQNTDRYGRFSIPLFALSYLQIEVIITTPLGNKKVYAIKIL